MLQNHIQKESTHRCTHSKKMQTYARTHNSWQLVTNKKVLLPLGRKETGRFHRELTDELNVMI